MGKEKVLIQDSFVEVVKKLKSNRVIINILGPPHNFDLVIQLLDFVRKTSGLGQYSVRCYSFLNGCFIIHTYFAVDDIFSHVLQTAFML